MNRSDWKTFYHPKYGQYLYKHKGTGVVTDSIFKIGKVLKKPLVNLVKKAGKKVAEKGIEKASTVVVEKAGDKIENVLRKRSKRPIEARKATKQPAGTSTRPPTTNYHQDLLRLNNLISQLLYLKGIIIFHHHPQKSIWPYLAHSSRQCYFYHLLHKL